jgi:hypothetical protein
MQSRIVPLDISCFYEAPTDCPEMRLILLEVEDPHFIGIYRSAEMAADRLAKLALEDAQDGVRRVGTAQRPGNGDRVDDAPMPEPSRTVVRLRR